MSDTRQLYAAYRAALDAELSAIAAAPTLRGHSGVSVDGLDKLHAATCRTYDAYHAARELHRRVYTRVAITTVGDHVCDDQTEQRERAARRQEENHQEQQRELRRPWP